MPIPYTPTPIHPANSQLASNVAYNVERTSLLLAASLGLEDALDNGGLLDQESAGDAVVAMGGMYRGRVESDGVRAE